MCSLGRGSSVVVRGLPPAGIYRRAFVGDGSPGDARRWRDLGVVFRHAEAIGSQP